MPLLVRSLPRDRDLDRFFPSRVSSMKATNNWRIGGMHAAIMMTNCSVLENFISNVRVNIAF